MFPLEPSSVLGLEPFIEDRVGNDTTLKTLKITLMPMFGDYQGQHRRCASRAAWLDSLSAVTRTDSLAVSHEDELRDRQHRKVRFWPQGRVGLCGHGETMCDRCRVVNVLIESAGTFEALMCRREEMEWELGLCCGMRGVTSMPRRSVYIYPRSHT